MWQNRQMSGGIGFISVILFRVVTIYIESNLYYRFQIVRILFYVIMSLFVRLCPSRSTDRSAGVCRAAGAGDRMVILFSYQVLPYRMQSPTYEDVIRFHGHTCPGVTFGYRAAGIAMERTGSVRAPDEELVVIVENNSSAAWMPSRSSAACTVRMENFTP